MKVSPVAVTAPSLNPNEGMSADPDRLARAKAIAMGQEPQAAPPVDRQVDRANNMMKKIKLKTQVSQDRHQRLDAPANSTAETTVVDDKVEVSEPAPVATDDTKQLSPQAAAIAKQKRALQLKEQELLAKEKALSTQSTDKTSLEEYRARIKTSALKVLREEGVTYDQLTEQILADNQDNEALSVLEAKIKALEEGVDKKFSEREAREEESALTEMLYEAEALAKDGDTYELIRERNAFDKVLRQIYTHYKQTGRVLDVASVMQTVESQLIDEALSLAKNKKVQGRLNPTPQTTQAAPTDRSNVKTMRTLTNRDGSSSAEMSKRERAIAAMEGRLK